MIEFWVPLTVYLVAMEERLTCDTIKSNADEIVPQTYVGVGYQLQN